MNKMISKKKSSIFKATFIDKFTNNNLATNLLYVFLYYLYYIIFLCYIFIFFMLYYIIYIFLLCFIKIFRNLSSILKLK